MSGESRVWLSKLACSLEDGKKKSKKMKKSANECKIRLMWLEWPYLDLPLVYSHALALLWTCFPRLFLKNEGGERGRKMVVEQGPNSWRENNGLADVKGQGEKVRMGLCEEGRPLLYQCMCIHPSNPGLWRTIIDELHAQRRDRKLCSKSQQNKVMAACLSHPMMPDHK